MINSTYEYVRWTKNQGPRVTTNVTKAPLACCWSWLHTQWCHVLLHARIQVIAGTIHRRAMRPRVRARPRLV